MQKIKAFLQENISFQELDLDHIIDLTKQYTDSESPEYKLLEIALNQLLSKYLETAQSYIEK